jgi:hypothetical protein
VRQGQHALQQRDLGLALLARQAELVGASLGLEQQLGVARFAEARTQAIETGLPYQFRFTPGTGKYRIEPWSPPASGDAASGSISSTSAPAATPPPAASVSGKADTPATHKTLGETPVIEAILPETILFQGGQAAVDDPVKEERRVNSLEESKATWTTPILFFPDGSSSQATVVLQNDAVQYLRITLRGLTAVARVSPVMTHSELDQTSQTR